MDEKWKISDIAHMIQAFYAYPKKKNTCKPQKFSHKLFIMYLHILCIKLLKIVLHMFYSLRRLLSILLEINLFSLLRNKTMDWLRFFVNQMGIMHRIACNWNIRLTMNEPNSCFRARIISIFDFWIWTFKKTKTFIYRETNAKNKWRKQVW